MTTNLDCLVTKNFWLPFDNLQESTMHDQMATKRGSITIRLLVSMGNRNKFSHHQTYGDQNL
jgi:hypothetical protein